MRAVRAVRASEIETADRTSTKETTSTSSAEPVKSLGESLFGVKTPTSTQANPFSSKSTAPSANPFSSSATTTTEPTTDIQTQKSDNLAQTFADKVRIFSASASTPPSQPAQPREPWQNDSSPYPSYYVDAEKEYLEPEPQSVPSNARLDTEDGSTSAAEEKSLFESSMDKTFQRFADTVNQNPEQILRYEFAGQPLLYSKDDAVGKLFSHTTVGAKVQTSTSTSANESSAMARIPRCENCGAARVFELQLTPHAITELEREEEGIDGMDWGTIIVGVCSADCEEKGKGQGDVAYLEEWIGVQWEELAEGMKR